jgi:hypothetical protein
MVPASHNTIARHPHQGRVKGGAKGFSQPSRLPILRSQLDGVPPQKPSRGFVLGPAHRLQAPEGRDQSVPISASLHRLPRQCGFRPLLQRDAA